LNIISPSLAVSKAVERGVEEGIVGTSARGPRACRGARVAG